MLALTESIKIKLPDEVFLSILNPLSLLELSFQLRITAVGPEIL